MRRREVIKLLGATAIAWPALARAQEPAVPVIGFLSSNSLSNDAIVQRLSAFQQGLTETGYVEGQNLKVEYRWAEYHNDRLPAMASDLVHRNVATIATQGNYAVLVAKAATSTIPIVFSGGFDPVGIGIVATLSRPGGNITGASFLANALEGKRLGLIHLLVPRATVMAAMINPDNASAVAQEKELRGAANTLGVELQIGHVRNERDFEPAFATFVERGARGLVIATDSFGRSVRTRHRRGSSLHPRS
jgi:putative ABC transport system substrate-binding protein